MSKLRHAVLLVLVGTAFIAAQDVPARPPLSAPPKEPAAQERPQTQPDVEKRSQAYYFFTLAHFYEEMYEATSQSEYATLAIENYRKAQELDPRAGVIGERLAEVYARSQRIRDAVLEAQEIIRRDPDNLSARRLLGRIYLRALGDLSSATPQSELVGRAIEQYREIVRLDPGDTDAALWLARLYRLRNEHDKAEEVLRGVLVVQPESESVLEQLTQLLLDGGRTQEAITLLERVAERSPTPNLLDLLGDAYAQTQQYARAEQVFRRALEMDPADADHRRGLAQALLAQDKFEEALEHFQRLTQLEPNNPENYLRTAQIYRRLKKLDKAEETLLRARQLAPGNLEVIYNEALLYETQGRFDDAIRVLSDTAAAMRARPGRGANRHTLGILYEQLGRLYREVENFPAALDTFREMLTLGQDEEKRARTLLADTYRASKDITKALEESNKALELFPQDRGLRVTHAMLLGEKGDTEEAAKLLRAQLDGSDDREIYLSLAQIFERGRRFADAEQAARMAEQMAARPAENEMVWFLLGAIYERQKKFDLAEEQFKKVLQLNPRNGPVLNYYGYMLADRSVRLDEAVALVARALDEEPYNGAYLDSLGWAYFRQNRLAEAEEYLRKAVGRAGHDPTIREHLGEIFYKTGRIELAAAEWEKALAEWQRALPTELEPDKVAELEKKLASLKHRLAQQKSAGQAKPE